MAFYSRSDLLANIEYFRDAFSDFEIIGNPLKSDKLAPIEFSSKSPIRRQPPEISCKSKVTS